MRRTVLAGLAVLAVVVCSVGCGAVGAPNAGTEPDRGECGTPSAKTTPAPASEPKPTPTSEATPEPTPEPTPTEPALPEPANGTDLKACSDARCEVLVEAGSSIPLDDRFGFTSFVVTSVRGRTVSIETAYPNGGGSLSVSVGAFAGSNGIGVEVPAVDRGRAVLLLSPM